MKASDIRRGTVLIYEGNPCRVMEFQHRTPGNLRAFVQVRMRNLNTGNTFETRFASTEVIEEARLDTKESKPLKLKPPCGDKPVILLKPSVIKAAAETVGRRKTKKIMTFKTFSMLPPFLAFLYFLRLINYRETPTRKQKMISTAS